MLLNIRSVLEIKHYYRSRENVGFIELYEIKNTVSNQNFPG